MVEAIPEEREEELRGFYENLGFKKTGKVIDHPQMYNQVIWLEYSLDL